MRLLKKMYVSQPSLSIQYAIWKRNWALKFLFVELVRGHFDPSEWNLWKSAGRGCQGVWYFCKSICQSEEEKKEFSISSQHYDFLPPLMTEFSIRYPENKNFRIFESTTVQILDEVAQGHSELLPCYIWEEKREEGGGEREKIPMLFISSRQNTKGIMQRSW